MFTRILPKQADNVYGGRKLAVWLLAVFVLVKFLQGATSTFYTHLALTGADAIPLDNYNAAGAQAVISLFALLGLYIMVFALPTIGALVRYRALVPLMYLLWLIEEVSKIVILSMNPIARSTSLPSGVIVNRVLLAVLVLGFLLSLMRPPRKSERRQQSGSA